MRRYDLAVRVLYALVFIGGGVFHAVAGRTMPGAYAAFEHTALVPGLAWLWRAFVMPNLGWLTLATAAFEVVCGIGLLVRRTVLPAALAILGFLVFVTLLGYGWPTTSALEDLAKNRASTIVMALVLLPVAWRRLTSAAGRSGPAPDAPPADRRARGAA